MAYRHEIIPLMREKYGAVDEEKLIMRRFRTITKKIGKVLGILLKNMKVRDNIVCILLCQNGGKVGQNSKEYTLAVSKSQRCRKL